MDKTLFIASFPDLGSFDFSKTNIKVGNIDNSDYFLNGINFNYIHSYINGLKSLIGTCDILFVPATNNVISALNKENIKCIVLYPNKLCKDIFINDMLRSGIDSSYVSMVENSWDFVVSRLEKYDYDYKFVMGEDDNVLNVLNLLLNKRDVLGVSKSDDSPLICDELVDSIFSYCLLREDEFYLGKPTIQSVFCEGIKYDYFFSSMRLSEKCESITSLINSIYAIDSGVSANDLGILRDGRKWTDSFDSLEKVMVLGISNGDLILPFSRDLDESLKGKVPYVIKKDILGKNVTV